MMSADAGSSTMTGDGVMGGGIIVGTGVDGCGVTVGV